MFVWPSGWMPAIWACRSPIWPSGAVWTTQWADSLKPTTPISSRADIAAAARRIASLPMSTLRTPAMALPPPWSKVLQWQAAIEPDWSMTTTRAMSAASPVAHAHVDRQALLQGRLLESAGAVRVGTADHDQPPAEVADVGLQGGHLDVGQAGPGHVDEDHAVVRGERREVGRDRLRHHHLGLLALLGQGGQELRPLPSRRPPR